MKEIVFITGNKYKAEYLSKYLGYPVQYQKADLDELQSLDLQQIVEHKVRQAYQLIGRPVIVEDVSLEFTAWGGLPGPFIKFFIEQMLEQEICDSLQKMNRQAKARCVFGYYDGEVLQFFEGGMGGTIAETPAGENGYGWDRIFIPEGYTVTRASLNEEDNQKTYTTIKPFAALKDFLEQ
jgi:inosine triphosphate pyrophosphatase